MRLLQLLRRSQSLALARDAVITSTIAAVTSAAIAHLLTHMA